MEKGRLFTGARARFSLSGVKVGYARRVSVSERNDYEEVEVLDNIEIEEHVPVGYKVTFTAEMFRIVGDTIKERGWFPSVGGNKEEHLSNILTSGDLTATIEDTKTGKLFATLEQVKIQGHSWTIDPRGVVGEEMEFVAIRLRDESEI